MPKSTNIKSLGKNLNNKINTLSSSSKNKKKKSSQELPAGYKEATFPPTTTTSPSPIPSNDTSFSDTDITKQMAPTMAAASDTVAASTEVTQTPSMPSNKSDHWDDIYNKFLERVKENDNDQNQSLSDNQQIKTNSQSIINQLTQLLNNDTNKANSIIGEIQEEIKKTHLSLSSESSLDENVINNVILPIKLMRKVIEITNEQSAQLLEKYKESHGINKKDDFYKSQDGTIYFRMYDKKKSEKLLIPTPKEIQTLYYVHRKTVKERIMQSLFDKNDERLLNEDSQRLFLQYSINEMISHFKAAKSFLETEHTEKLVTLDEGDTNQEPYVIETKNKQNTKKSTKPSFILESPIVDTHHEENNSSKSKIISVAKSVSRNFLSAFDKIGLNKDDDKEMKYFRVKLNEFKEKIKKLSSKKNRTKEEACQLENDLDAYKKLHNKLEDRHKNHDEVIRELEEGFKKLAEPKDHSGQYMNNTDKNDDKKPQ